MPSIFTRIVMGEIPCHKVAEDDRFLAFLDVNPLREGHTLVIPKMEVDKFFELPAELDRLAMGRCRSLMANRAQSYITSGQTQAVIVVDCFRS